MPDNATSQSSSPIPSVPEGGGVASPTASSPRSAALLQQIDGLRNYVLASERTIEEVEGINRRLTSERSELVDAISELRNEVRNEVSELRSENSALRSQNSDLRNELAELRSHVADLSRRVQESLPAIAEVAANPIPSAVPELTVPTHEEERDHFDAISEAATQPDEVGSDLDSDSNDGRNGDNNDQGTNEVVSVDRDPEEHQKERLQLEGTASATDTAASTNVAPSSVGISAQALTTVAVASANAVAPRGNAPQGQTQTPTHPDGAFTGQYVVSSRSANGRPIFRGSRGGVFYETSGGNKKYL